MKKFLLSLLAFATAVAASAATVTFVASSDYDESYTSSAGAWTVTKDGVSLSCTNGMTNTANGQYRIYKSQTLTVSSSYTITEIVFTCTAQDDAQYGPGCFTVDTGSYSYSSYTGTWAGSSTEIVFTASTNQVRATTIEVTYTDGDETQVATPKISPTAGTYYEATDVTISTSTDGATLYYSTDGTTYSEYTGAFTISESCTVYAYGTKDGLTQSNTASATYTINLPTDVESISEALTYVESDGIVKFTNPVTAVYQNGYYTYVKDDTGWMLIYGSIEDYENGDVIPAGFYGKMTSYYNLYEMTTTIATSVYSSDSFEESTTNNGAVEPTTYTLGEIDSSKMNQYVRFYSVTFDADNKSISDEEDALAIYYRWSDVETPESGTYDVEGFVSVYSSTVQLYPTAFNEESGVITLESDPSDITVTGGDGTITVLGQAGCVEVYTIGGALVSRGSSAVECRPGIYIVRAGSTATKVAVR